MKYCYFVRKNIACTRPNWACPKNGEKRYSRGWYEANRASTRKLITACVAETHISLATYINSFVQSFMRSLVVKALNVHHQCCSWMTMANSLQSHNCCDLSCSPGRHTSCQPSSPVYSPSHPSSPVCSLSHTLHPLSVPLHTLHPLPFPFHMSVIFGKQV